MADSHFNAWKRVADEAITNTGLERELRFVSVGGRKSDPKYLELVVKGTDPLFGTIVIAVEDGGTRMPTTSDVDDVSSAIREKWDDVTG